MQFNLGDVNNLKEIDSGPDKRFVFQIPENYSPPSPEDVERIKKVFDEALNGAKALILPPGVKLVRVSELPEPGKIFVNQSSVNTLLTCFVSALVSVVVSLVFQWLFW